MGLKKVKILNKTKLAPKYLELELTESIVKENTLFSKPLPAQEFSLLLKKTQFNIHKQRYPTFSNTYAPDLPSS